MMLLLIATCPRRIAALPPAVALLMAASGCGLLSGPSKHATNFYVLTSPSESAAPAARRLVIGLGPIHLPPYLERPEMVTRIAPNQLWFDEFNRWGEPLKSNFEHVLATELDNILNLERVVAFPWYKGTPMDYTVLVAVSRFETQPSGEVVLDARWGIGGPNGETLVSREAHFTHAGGSPAETAAGLSDVVGQLAVEIASALRTADAGKR